MGKTNFEHYATINVFEDAILSTKVFACYVRNVLMKEPCDTPCEKCRGIVIDWLNADYVEPAPELSQIAKDVLKLYFDMGYTNITRDSDCDEIVLYVDGTPMAFVHIVEPFTSLFKSIKKGYKIADLIK